MIGLCWCTLVLNYENVCKLGRIQTLLYQDNENI